MPASIDNVNVLVFPCGSEIGLEIHAALAGSRFVTLYGGSSVDDHGRFVYRNYIADLPPVDSPEFVAAVSAAVRRFDIDLIFPAHDSVVLALARRSAEIGCKVLTSPRATCEICRSKRATYEYLVGKVAVPTMYPLESRALPFPVFLKPDVGQGSKGTHVAYSHEDVAFYSRQEADMLVLEYLPGAEYTVDCFTDVGGNLLFSGPRIRSRVSNGISVNTSCVDSPALAEMAQKINALLKLQGAWFFQAKASQEGELKLMEVAPRVAGSMGIQRARGANLPLLSVFDAMGVPVRIEPNAIEFELDRALGNRYRSNLEYEHVYVDLDDTLVLRGKISPVLIAFLYQCLNNGKKVHLLSSHVGDIHGCLAGFRLAGVFDSVIHLDKSKSKADYTVGAPAIFIDDSFEERSRVAARWHMPTFDLSGLECLLDWRA
jgi:hypothetical protein